MKYDRLSRRAFLAATTTTAVWGAMAQAPNTAQVVPRKLSPNEKLNVAAIGAGGKGTSDIMSCKKLGENVVALCDVDWERAGESFYRNPDAKKFKDYRNMLEKMPEIDALTISTPDHTHAPAAYMAMKMGKHVYVQKPLTHTVAEARLLANTAREMGVMTQMGNQGHCGNGVRTLCEMIWSGAIGNVREAHVWTHRPVWDNQGRTEALPAEVTPEDLDWDRWIGCAPWRPYNHKLAPHDWRAWLDFGGGSLGDMACHIMDPAFWSLKLYEAPAYSVEVLEQEGMNEETAPKKCVIKYQFPARGAMPPVDVYWYDGGIMPKRPDGVPENQKMGDGDNGSLFIGAKGVMTSGCYGGESRLLPDELMKDFKRPEPTIPRIEGENPYLNWLACCKTGEQAVSDFSYAGPLTEVANMGNVALWAGEKIEYDVASMKITNVKKANKFLSKKYRKGWELPV